MTKDIHRINNEQDVSVSNFEFDFFKEDVE